MTDKMDSFTEGEIGRLVEVARMYYEKNMTQAAIAEELGVSRPLVSKMLERARSVGIVHIEIKDFSQQNDSLMRRLQEKYQISGGLVVPEANNDYLTSQMVVKQAVEFVLRILTPDVVLGLGWGYTVGSIVEAFEARNERSVCRGLVCPLMGAAGVPNRGYHTNELTRVFAECTGLRPQLLFAPMFPSSRQEQELFRLTENYKTIAALWECLDVALVGVGAYPCVPDEATATRFGDLLSRRKAVGSIVSHYFDAKGNIIAGADDFAMRIDLTALRNTKRVIAIALSNTNVVSLEGALKTRLITDLIVDEKIASALLEK